VLRDFLASHPDFDDRVADDGASLHPGWGSIESPCMDLDAGAAALGLELAGNYPLDLFHAERHATGSHFRLDTSLRFTSCGTILLR
jgi:hypothetical protein